MFNLTYRNRDQNVNILVDEGSFYLIMIKGYLILSDFFYAIWESKDDLM